MTTERCHPDHVVMQLAGKNVGHTTPVAATSHKPPFQINQFDGGADQHRLDFQWRIKEVRNYVVLLIGVILHPSSQRDASW
jgi:hypothetical protein